MKEKYYHGSPDAGVTEILKSSPDHTFVFYGMFFGDWETAKSHASPYIYSVEVDTDNLVDASHFAYDSNAYEAIQEAFGEPLDDEDLFHDLVSQRESVWDSDLTEADKDKLNQLFGKVLGYFPGTETHELDWAFQSAAAYIAEKLGYEGVWVPDEHGESLIVTPGHKLRKEI